MNNPLTRRQRRIALVLTLVLEAIWAVAIVGAVAWIVLVNPPWMFR